MKLAILLVVGSLSWAGLSHARLGDPINTRQRAEINGKMADLPMAEMRIVEFPNQPQPKAPVNQRRWGTRTVPMPRTSTATVSTPIVPTEVRSSPMANFGSKRPANLSRRVPTETVDTTTLANQPAPITNRVISVTTPAGQQELVDQLKLRKP